MCAEACQFYIETEDPNLTPIHKLDLLKRFYRRGGMIALEAANPAYETRIFTDDRVKVQGKLVGLIRTY